MFDDPQSRVEHALGRLAAARQALAAVDLAALSRDELLDLMAAVEIDSRQRAAVGYALVAELDARGIAAELGCSATAVVLSERLRIGRREAAGRVRLALEMARAAARLTATPARAVTSTSTPVTAGGAISRRIAS